MAEIEIHRITKIVLEHGQIITFRTEDEPKVIAALMKKPSAFTPLDVPIVEGTERRMPAR